MRRLSISFFLSAGVLFFSACGFAAETLLADQAADPAAGRKAFVKLQCTACHKVMSDPGLPAMTASEGAPILGGMTTVHTEEQLAWAIIQPSHTFAPGFHGAEGEVSRMGDQGDTMTVRQLRDIIAYLKAQEQTGAAPAESYVVKAGYEEPANPA